MKIETIIGQSKPKNDAKKLDDTVEGFYNFDHFDSENTINDFNRIFDENKERTCITLNREHGSNLFDKSIIY